MPHILLVEDDELFRTALKNVLESQKHQVTEAENGKVAREIIRVSAPFDLILSDIQMPFLTGVELLEWVKANKPSPFILMTGFALVMETQKAHEIGADDFLAKPFNESELESALKKLLHRETLSDKLKSSPVVEYCKVSLDEFVSTHKIRFDVYIQLGEKYVKIGHKGDDVPKERIAHYREKGLKHLFILRDDFRQLVEFNLTVLKAIKSKDAIAHDKKMQFLRYSGEVILETAFVKGMDLETFNDAKDFLATGMEILAEEQETFEMINMLNAHSDFLYAHSLCVSIYSVMIGKKLGWTSSQILFKLSLCGLFHDIGKKEIERSILEKPRALLSQAERGLIETHPTRGREILSSLKAIPTEVSTVAFEHHEDNLGSGYPQRLTKRQMHPFTQVVRAANLFANQILKTPGKHLVNAQGGLQYLTTHFVETIEPSVLEALKKVIS